MKYLKILSLILLLISFLLTGCLSLRPTTASTDKTDRIVTLKGNPSTGYTWKYRIENPKIVTVEESHSYKGDSNFVGSPSDFTYTIKPLREGKTMILFIYARPWEEEPAEIRQFTAAVDKNGLLTLSENQ